MAERLGLAPGDTVFHTLIVHCENELPLQCEDRYVNPARALTTCRSTSRRPRRRTNLLEVAPLWEAQVAIEAAVPTAQEARLLGVARGTPCLIVTRPHREPRAAGDAGAPGASGHALPARGALPAMSSRRRPLPCAGACAARPEGVP
jgi:hypothetical protein